MKIQSTNWDQRQFVDMASAPSDNKEGWRKVSEKNPNKTYQINGHSYKVVAKMERRHQTMGGIVLGLLCTIGSLGLAPLFSKSVRQLFTGRQVLRVVEEVFPHINEKGNPLPVAKKASPPPLPLVIKEESPPQNAADTLKSNQASTKEAENNQKQFFTSLDRAASNYPKNYTTQTGDKSYIPNLIKHAYSQSSSLEDFKNRLQGLQQSGQLKSLAGSGFQTVAYLVKMAESAPPLAPLQGIIAPQAQQANTAQSQKAKIYAPTDLSRAQIYQNAPTYPSTHPLFETMSDPGGAGNVVNKIQQLSPNARCGVMICANSGLPCGQVGADGHGDIKTLNAKTQEESIIANVLMTQFGNDKSKHKQFIDASFKGVWGMVDGPTGHSTMTHQGIDFRHATDASAYNQAYALNKCQLGVTTGTGTNKTLIPGQKNEVTLIFADSINANPSIGTPTGTMQRTMNEKASNDYQFFRECVKTKLRSSLDAMVAEGNTHAIVGRLSCGIYAPDKWKQGPTNINKDFDKILAEVLNEQVGPSGETRRSYFQQVVIPHISK
ncbi:hypothetical protein [Estrella lausannensis]|uniref:Putative membrane protein n=1 Tax=Estrella lausannensis TaxID=483423 RepID=A0A0H5DQJ2_9BACT|nr:hypothetical protein [Estrella lausannensis]CRX37834.1 putative membrane protein [Estrella lausannensis]